MDDADKLVESLREPLPTEPHPTKSGWVCVWETHLDLVSEQRERAADWIESHQRAVEMAARKAVEECATICEKRVQMRPLTIATEDAKVVLALLDNPDFWNTINAAAPNTKGKS